MTEKYFKNGKSSTAIIGEQFISVMLLGSVYCIKTGTNPHFIDDTKHDVETTREEFFQRLFVAITYMDKVYAKVLQDI